MSPRKTTEITLPPWTIARGDKVMAFKALEVNSIDDMPKGTYGFIYRITFMDGMKYIGKKNIYSVRTKTALKNGKVREGAERIYKNTGKGFRQAFDIVKAESDWKSYCGSHKECKIRKPKIREILHYAFNKLQLTYLEAKYLFACEVLEDETYINDNILGSFYRSSFCD